jgi:hypothetical protein
MSVYQKLSNTLWKLTPGGNPVIEKRSRDCHKAARHLCCTARTCLHADRF